jgi:nickel/cobalt exporter
MVSAQALHVGLVLGLRHASDADHVCTVASLLRGGSSPWPALRTAIFWGLGHTLTLLGVGLAVVGLGLGLPAWLEVGVERAVAVSLVWLGVNQWRQAPAPRVVAPATGGRLRAMALGLLHGLAGSGGAVLLAPANAPHVRAAAAWLAVFGLGTVVGMVVVTLVLSAPLRFVERRGGAWHARVQRAAAALSVVVGVWLFLSSTGVTDA